MSSGIIAHGFSHASGFLQNLFQFGLIFIEEQWPELSKHIPDEVSPSDLYNDTNTFTVPLDLAWLKLLFKTKNNSKST